MSVDTKERIKQQIKENLSDRIIVKRLIYYIFDSETRNAVLYQDASLENEWDNPDTKELYTLKDVAMYHDGIPVYIIKKGFNFSVGFDFKTNSEKNMKLVEKGYTPEDMSAVLTSQTTNRLFRTIRKLDTSMIFAILFLNVISILVTVIVSMTIVNAVYG